LAFADRGMMAKVDMILEGIIGVERLWTAGLVALKQSCLRVRLLL
jgi:hypothetical protein